ncbi:hypothetical protein tinsulaeT_08180 [Thalassotalea insulae]|uniref:Cytochrome c domain-containing protein n=1 Tax=Thalassotalea insulae TaxID=2056778 RepID=A0ABQ6GNB5_9GAMM|nr:cytochrome c peroxidase [Thalassotalea insulae]GLX77478.1 hypothetical protein tinsulaeT_08180 [Thalassotalea insulae]
MKKPLLLSSLLVTTLLTAQWVNAQETPRRPGPDRPNPPPPTQPPRQPPTQPGPEDIDQRLQQIISDNNIQAIDTTALALPHITSEKAQLGKKLFFTKNLGGEQSVACVSCHHPLLGGGDSLSLSVGVAAVDELDNSAHDLLGIGRFNGNDDHPVVGRNAPTTFNIAFYNRGLFWDGRVERLRNGVLVTPDSEQTADGRRLPDNNIPQNVALTDAQARFPVVSTIEMRGNFQTGSSNQTIRTALVSRLDDQVNAIASNWPAEFAQVFNQQEVTVDHVFEAISDYERSMVFVNNPWQHYLAGDNDALSVDQKQGAILFFTPSQQGGAGCVACHNGTNFTDQRHHLVAFPQIGVGAGNSSNNATAQDFGRENVTNNSNDRFHFRTPSLLNVEVTAPYGHSGAYQTLEQVVAHYNNPRRAIERLYAAQGQQAFVDGEAPYCQLPQITALIDKHQLNCEQVFSDSFANSIEVADYLERARNNQISASAPLRARANLSAVQVQQVSAFLTALTDPCVKDKACLAPWLLSDDDIASFPDDQVLTAKDNLGNNL